MKKLFVTLLLFSYALIAFWAWIRIKTIPNPNDNWSTKAYQLFEIVENKLAWFNNEQDKIKYLDKLKDWINYLLVKYETNNKNYKALKFLKFLVLKELAQYSNPTTDGTGQYVYPKEVLLMYENWNLEWVIWFFWEKLKSDAFNLVYLINIAYAYYNLEKYDDTLVYLDKILDIDPTNTFAIETKLKALTKWNDYFGQIDFLENLVKKQSAIKERDLTYKRIAEIYLALWDYANSEIYYKKLKNLDNKDLFEELNSQRDKEVEKIEEYNNSSFSRSLFISWVWWTGDSLAKEKKFVSAIKFYDLVLNKYNDALEVCDKKTDVYIILKQYKEALENINKCLNTKKTYKLYFKKWEILEKLNKEDEAIESYNSAIMEESYHFEPFEKVALILEKQENLEKAVKYYEKAYENAKFDRFYKKIQELNQKIEDKKFEEEEK